MFHHDIMLTPSWVVKFIFHVFFTSRGNLYDLKLERIARRIREIAGDPNLEFERSAAGKLLIPGEYLRNPAFGIDR